MSYIWRGALQWWDDWQLRILVLGSLGLQWFLLLAAPMRKYSLPPVLRTFIWLAYISSDPLAIYALATLFNRHAKTSNFGGDTGSEQQSSILEVLWAPILLICLGGQEGMSGYEIEDNKLWGRHTVTLVSQVAVALYAFYKSWPRSSDPKLLVVAVLLFVVGVVSFSEKPWALKAKARRLAAVSSSGGQGIKKPSRWRQRMNQFFFRLSNCFTCTGMPQSHFPAGGEEEGSRKQVILTEADRVLMVLADMSLLAAAKDLVAQHKAGEVEDVLQPLPVVGRALPRWLQIIFAFHYTREHVVGGPDPLYLLYHRLLVPILHIAALTLFAMSGKQPYKHTDVKITYIILCLTAAMDVLALSIHRLIYWLMSKTNATALCETVPSYNLIDTALQEGDKSIGWVYMCARSMGFNCNFNSFCRPQLGQVYYRKVTQTVIADLVDALDRDLASYRIFHSSNWALSEEQQEHCGVEIKKCLRVSFDRSVLLWHIATDLCFRCCLGYDLVDDVGEQAEYRGGLQGGGSEEFDEGGREELDEGGSEEEDDDEEEEEEQQQQMRRDPSLKLHMECTFAISNYMAHLLNFNPEMLLTGSRHHLISEAMEEIKSSFLSKKDKLTQKEQLKGLIAAMAEGEHQSVNGHDDPSQVFVHITEACKLAKELLELPDPRTRWMLMYRVWLGMLCYSASMCRGYLHAKSLGEGGEFLTYVWLVLILKGAKSLVDKLQMPPETQVSDNAESQA